MTETQKEPGATSIVGRVKAFIRNVWTTLWRPTTRFSLGTLFFGGCVIGIAGWGGFNWTAELANTETFCISCHEMRVNVYDEYKGSVHDSNPSGIRATCPDCHVPKPWAYKMARKVQASNELIHWALGSINTREKFEDQRDDMAQRVWKVMKKTDSRECRNCHSFKAMDVTLQQKRARNRHLEAEDQGKTCIDCHKGIAHQLPEGALGLEDMFNADWTEKNGH